MTKPGLYAEWNFGLKDPSRAKMLNAQNPQWVELDNGDGCMSQFWKSRK